MQEIGNLDYSDQSRIGSMYYGDERTGAYIGWPGSQWCVDGDYDPRLRPWYSETVTGPKNMLILLDKSQSMDSSGFWASAQTAVKTLVDSLGERDYVNVITFSSFADVYNQEPTLLRATTANRERLKTFIDAQGVFGGTDFRVGLELAATSLSNARSNSQTSGCSSYIMILTDGEEDAAVPFTMEDYDQLGLQDVPIFMYTLGPQAPAEDSIVHKLAHETNGIHRCVPDANSIVPAMLSYYDAFIASGVPSTVRWTNEYEAADSGAKLVAGCRPVFQPTPTGEERLPILEGVVCVDVSILQDLAVFKGKPDYPATWSEMIEDGARCSNVHLSGWTLSQLRAEAAQSCPTAKASFGTNQMSTALSLALALAGFMVAHRL